MFLQGVNELFYDSELHFLQSVLKKCRVQTQIINANENPEATLDLGLRVLLGIDNHFERPLVEVLGEISPNTIHILTDGYLCKYIYLQLPGDDEENVLVIGPYQIKQLNHEELLELAEKNAVSPSLMRDFERYYNGLPLIGDEGQLISLIDTFGEFIWSGSSNYKFEEYELETNFDNVTAIINKSLSEHDGIVWNSKLIEARYAYEKEFLFAVSQGNYPKAKHLMSQFNSIQIDQRNADPIRDMKNYCITINTLFRKSVERGGVHPIHIDSVSSEFVKKKDCVGRISSEVIALCPPGISILLPGELIELQFVENVLFEIQTWHSFNNLCRSLFNMVCLSGENRYQGISDYIYEA